ncbi:hypothetical protein M3148_03120 [Georgenia satyanarayanai]|uniref:hypothetical protein n=1 Tax=Georgenia satyanarayanai TaxID=860221 RepID=UPI00203BE2E9|nr:hypothetical protein [Georgenia satyanarayanai]MCM3659990.1 hypothetical protein [Georgenia satyanarayanai]
MAGIGDFGASSFDSYEGIRIIIPGFVVFTVGFAAYSTVAPGDTGLMTSDALLTVAAAIVVGLVLYFWDFPAQSAAYLERQPTEHLEQMYPHIQPARLLTSYLLILNTRMPANIRNRSLYMGSMYRIGLETILAMAVSSAVVFGASLFDYGSSSEDGIGLARNWCAVSIWFTVALGVVLNRGYEKKSGARLQKFRTGWLTLRESVASIRHPSMWIYGAGLVAILCAPGAGRWLHWSPVGVSVCASGGFALSFFYWARRYVRGDGVSGDVRKRKRLPPLAAGALLAAPVSVLLLFAQASQRSILNDLTLLCAWTALTNLMIISVMIRGHERKLHGAYAGQKRWLRDFPEEYLDLIPEDPVGTGRRNEPSKHRGGLTVTLLVATLVARRIFARRIGDR